MVIALNWGMFPHVRDNTKTKCPRKHIPQKIYVTCLWINLLFYLTALGAAKESVTEFRGAMSINWKPIVIVNIFYHSKVTGHLPRLLELFVFPYPYYIYHQWELDFDMVSDKGQVSCFKLIIIIPISCIGWYVSTSYAQTRATQGDSAPQLPTEIESPVNSRGS